MRKLDLNIQRFSATNSTTNYELPQFVGTDKPSWLTDFNSAMSTIDTGMHTNAGNISTLSTDVATASSTASQASSDVATLTSTVNSLSSDVSSISTTATNASSTATSALNTANTANGKADTNATAITGLTGRVTQTEADIAKFNFTNIKASTLTKSGGTFTLATGNSITVATDSTGSICKIYGQITANSVTANGKVIADSDLRPSEDIEINGCAIRSVTNGGNVKSMGNLPITIKTNGNIEFPIGWSYASGDTVRINAIACVIFLKDFGDTPIVGD